MKCFVFTRFGTDEDEDAAIRAQCAANSNASNPLPIIAIVAPCDTAILDKERTVCGSSMGNDVVVD